MKMRMCGPSDARGRLAKAKQFHDAAELIREFAENEAEVGDAVVTLLVHAGIAAADAICCAALGEHAQGENHVEAVQHLKRVSPDGDKLSEALHSLLSAKTRAGYSAEPVNADMRKRTKRAADVLVAAAKDRVG
jgi:hypothetical protein